MSRRGPMLFTPHEIGIMSRCAECGGDVAEGAKVEGRLVHRGTCEEVARMDLREGHRSVPDPPAFVYPDEL